ncbi:MAG TPA: resolvase, partial [Desulfosporosinus sp.]|nr:resolvase [Desulfosporosinus sp.]
MNIAYIRVSTIDQNEERQIKAMEKENIKKYFTEKVSAKDT